MPQRKRPPAPSPPSRRSKPSLSSWGPWRGWGLAVALGAISIVVVAALLRRVPGHFSSSSDLPRSLDQNILLVTIDTLRADALGCYGGQARTPNIDRLAESGVRFSFTHAHTVVTLPSHASILTGRYPFQHGYRENSGYRLAAGMPTMATLLKAHGFATAAFVAAFPLDARFGLTPGFDVYDGRFDDMSGGGFIIAERPATAVVAQATSWIRAQTGRWFAWVHVYEPHAPYRPPPPFDREYADRPYVGEVAAADRGLGPLLDLDRQSSRPTLVVITGDHGEALGDHGETTHGLFAYESTLRIPLIMSQVGAGATRLGAVSDAPARHIDILPTVLDALEIPPPPDLPGHSLRRDEDRKSGADRPSYFEAMSSMLDFGWAPLSGVLTGREKYIDLPMPELYDLATDQPEAVNLVARAAERQRVLAARLASFKAPLPSAPHAEDPEVAGRLQSLGYVSGGAPRKARYTDEDDPKNLVALDKQMHDAVALDEDGHPQEAIAVYRQVLARRADMMAASRHLAFDYWRTGDAAAAVETLRAALRVGPKPGAPGAAGAEIQLGTYLTDTGHASEALTLLRQAAASDPNLDALNALGIAYARSGHTADALATFERSLRIDSDNAMTHENIGAIHLDAGRLEAARMEFEHALRTNPDAAQGVAGLAMVAFRTGDKKTAFENWKRAVALDPTNFDALYDLGIQLVRDNQLAAARPYLEQFVRTAPASLYGKDIQNISAVLAKMR
jgi:arylsulfatase A-like enzyme/Tfp pilus assembly protein PilF